MLVKNFSYSIIYKILGMIISLMMVPLLINILGVEQYGLWVTLTSLFVWITLFDFGLGYALKNTVSKSLANNNIKEANIETKQILKITTLISTLLFLLFLVLLFLFDILRQNVYLSLILFIPIIVTFPLKIGSPILQGARKIALDSGLLFINTFLFFISISIVYFLDLQINITLLALLYAVSYIFSLFLVWFNAMKVIQMKIQDLRKVFDYSIDFQRIRLGLKFFGLQISSLVLYSIGTVIVFIYLTAIDAAHYDVINKIFIFGLSIFNIGIAVFWPEISHHLGHNDFLNIRKLYFIMLGLSIVFSIVSFIFSFWASDIIDIWTNGQISIEPKQTIYFAFLVSLQAIAYSGAVVLNAYEKINYQLAISLISTIFMMPLTIYFIGLDFGISSIPLSAGILTSFSAIYCNIHAFQLIQKGLLNDKTNNQ